MPQRKSARMFFARLTTSTSRPLTAFSSSASAGSPAARSFFVAASRTANESSPSSSIHREISYGDRPAGGAAAGNKDSNRRKAVTTRKERLENTTASTDGAAGLHAS